MMTIGEVSRIAHISVRTLRHYDKIGLLHPSAVSEGGYRLYDEEALKRLHLILLFRELEFPLSDVRRILDTPDFDLSRTLEDRIRLLTMKREHIDTLIALAAGLKLKGLNNMRFTNDDFAAYDARRLDDYAAQAKAAWGETPAWREYEQKTAHASAEDRKHTGDQLMALFAEFGRSRHLDPACPEAQAMARQIQDFITRNYYTCTPAIMRSLADMYDGGGDFTRNIDQAGGKGTAAFIARAMRILCEKEL
ncbi:MAG: MerR family transcriptional regulator [Clostridia bacterium]|nr:MerR family transcriptional regulator [Clostridia bacterium]